MEVSSLYHERIIILKSNLKQLQDDLGIFVPSLNNGGCYKFAYLIQLLLTEINIDSRIMIIPDGISRENTNLDYCKNNNLDNYVKHAIVYIPDLSLYFDGHKDVVLSRNITYITLDDDNGYKTYLYYSHRWNNQFTKKDEQILLDRLQEFRNYFNYFECYKDSSTVFNIKNYCANAPV